MIPLVFLPVASGVACPLRVGAGGVMLYSDDALTNLKPEDLGRVRSWIEDRFLNAVCPLALRLNLETPWVLSEDRTLQEAQRTIEKVLAAVEEVRRIDAQANA